jgi:hypothetical protein
MPGARISQHVVEVLTPLTPAGPYIPAANVQYNSTTNYKLVTGLAETIITSCDLTATGSPASVVAAWDIWLSQNLGANSPRTCVVRLRRTNVSGAILATSATVSETSAQDSNLGLFAEVWGSYTDNSPTDYHYVLTLQETTAGNTATELWVGASAFRLNPTVTAILSQDVIEVLAADTSRARVSQYVIEVLMADADTQTTPPAPPGGGGQSSFGYVS